MRRTPRKLTVLAVTLTLLSGCTLPFPGIGDGPSPSPAGFPCPPNERSSASPLPAPQLVSGRVQVGAVSYPAAPAPYTAPDGTEYMPFGNLIGSQHAPVEQVAATSMGWQSVIALARLSSVDGAWGLQKAAEVVSQCSLSMTWRGIDYHPAVRRDESITVDGHQGWIRITDLSFSVPGIRATAEVQTVVTVQVDDHSYAFLSYLPNSAPELQPAVDAARDGLRVKD
ncbi:MAG: hypothetical protein QM582_06765 [Micropruina sp.]|uniref:hypothetical protein n=1 Tax=Micropruina sp. TaxID=2737536 RepID=UPI0039E587CE